MFFVQEKNNVEGKGGKYLKKENKFSGRRRITKKEKEVHLLVHPNDHLREAGPSR